MRILRADLLAQALLRRSPQVRHTPIKPYLDSISFIEIPDILAVGAYDEADKDFQFILHLAAPIPDASLTGNPKKHSVDPAVQGALRLLEAAAKSPSVKRVVVTSSVVFLAPKTSGAVTGASDLASTPKEEDVPNEIRLAYRAAKAISHRASVK